MGGKLNTKFLYSSWQMERLDPVIIGGGLKLCLIHLVPPALRSVLKKVCVCVCACMPVWLLVSPLV